MIYYTGIGSRSTPVSVLRKMRDAGALLGQYKYCLRSGNAQGADTAFYEGHSINCQHYEIFLPWPNFGKIKNNKFIALPNIHRSLLIEATKIAETIHPAWYNCNDGAKKLHIRNVFQILGTDLNSPSKFVLCWTPNGELKGGTATAIRLALKYNIPVHNFAIDAIDVYNLI